MAASQSVSEPPVPPIESAPATGSEGPEPPPFAPTQPATQPEVAPPLELANLPEPVVGQYAVYALSTTGARPRLKQTVESIGPGPNDVTVSEQLVVDGQPTGSPATLRMPRFGPRWPRPVSNDVTTVSYGHERVELGGRSLECVVLTVETRSAGSVHVEKRWICPQVPVTHLVRLVLMTDGREIMRRELVDFGPQP